MRTLSKNLYFGTIAITNLLASSLMYASEPFFESSIPVIDMRLYENPETREQFSHQFTKALHEIGFCALTHTGFDQQALEKGYQASIEFFRSPREKKMELYFPELNGQRGLVIKENAQGKKSLDLKEFLHFGKKKNFWPVWMDLKTPVQNLIKHLDKHSEKLQDVLSRFMGQKEDFLFQMTDDGDCVLRALYYPKTPLPNQVWAAAHTDIDLFTILPMSTEKGLEILHKGEWVQVRVPKDAFIINCGDMLENMSNGYFKSSVHRVVSQANKERFSIVYFVHPRNTDRLDPLAKCIELTGGVKRFPDASHLEMLAHRLVEIGLASDDLKTYDSKSGYIERVEELVLKEVASDAVKKTYENWQKNPEIEQKTAQD
jgi:isopenicillin N synthase-like dioxygenase